MIFVYAAIFLVAIGLDQLTKALTVHFMDLYETVTVIPGVLNFTYVRNPGAAWGMFADNRALFMTMSVIGIAAISFLVWKYRKKPFLLLFPLILILAGGIGNMVDRIFRGTVVDMIEAAFIDFPIFNIADCCVTVGAVLFFIYIIFIDKTTFSDKKPAVSDAATGNTEAGTGECGADDSTKNTSGTDNSGEDTGESGADGSEGKNA